MFVITYKKIFLLLGTAFVLSSALIVGTIGLNFGIDFTGGALTEVSYSSDVAWVVSPEIQIDRNFDSRQLDLGNYSLRQSSAEDGRPSFILRTRDLAESERIEVHAALTEVLPESEIVRFTSVGPVIGEELKEKAKWAIGAVAIIIILYVAFAFRGVSHPVGSWVYGGITILALIHDVLIPTAAMVLMGYFAGVEVDVLFIMALLAVLGYSVNDTIVVFDRVRENLQQYRQEKKIKVTVDGGFEREEIEYVLTKPFGEIVGLSVSQTLMRSINTSVTTLLALVALYFIGGEVTKTFSLVLIVGVLAGTYSSIFFANPLLTYIGERKLNKKA